MKKLKFSIKTIFILLTFLALSLTMAVGLLLSVKSKNSLIQEESKRYFEQSIATAQIILNHELDKIYSIVNSAAFSPEVIEAIKTKKREVTLNYINHTLPASLDFNALIPLDDKKQIMLSGLLLYDTQALKQKLKTIQTSSTQKDVLHVETERGIYSYMIAAKGVVDDTGEVVALYVGGIELNNNVTLINEIKANTMIDKMVLLYKDKELIKDQKSTYKKPLDFTEYETPVFSQNKMICYRKQLLLDHKENGLNMKVAIYSDSIDSAKDMILKDLTIITIVALIIIVIFVFLINHFLIKPIERLKLYAKDFLKDSSAKEELLELNITEYQELSNYLYGLFSKLLYNQKKLISLNDTLEHKVAQKTKELTKQIEQMRQKDKLLQEQAKLASMGEMIDAIAHQWKTPLTSISFYAQDLEFMIENSELCEKDARRDIEGILFKVEHLVDTINSFREFFRPVSVIQPVSLKTLIESRILLMKDELLKHNITTTVEGEDTDILLIPNEFKHVMINLLNNSKDAFVKNKIENKKITFKIKKLSDYEVNVEFTDTAGGIPDEVIDHIFEPHFTTKEQEGGTGIGLYVSKLILDKIGAEINVTNVTKGARFEIKIYNACRVNITKLHT